MLPENIQDQFPAIKKIELKFLLSFVITLNLGTILPRKAAKAAAAKVRGKWLGNLGNTLAK